MINMIKVINQMTLVAVGAAAGLTLTGAAVSDVNASGTGMVIESFEEHMGPWTVRGNIDCFDPVECPRFFWEVTRTTDEAHEGEFSLDMTANGQWDNGSIWIERPIHLEPGEWEIGLSFQLHDIIDSPINPFPVTAYVAFEPPQEQQDFEWIGFTGHKGWKPYNYSRTLIAEEPTTAWVALGYRITWETCRTYLVDSIVLSGIPAQPEHRPGDLTHDGVVGVEDLLLLLVNWGPCPYEAYLCFCTDGDDCVTDSPDTDCVGDITGSAATGIDDLLILLTNWG